MDESNDPNDKGFAIIGNGDRELIAPSSGFATGEANFSGGFAGEAYKPDPYVIPYNFSDYVNSVVASRWNNPSGSTEIRHVNIPRPEMIFIPPNPAFGYLEIVQAVAETDSTYTIGVDFDDVPLERACPYCPAKMPYRLHDEPFPHDADCIVLKARAMVATMPHVEVKHE